jgi:RHS repeat-associated protein
MFLRKFAVAALSLAIVTPAFSQTWVEVGDAGSLPDQAQIAEGGGSLAAISGNLGPGDLEDMYLILINDPNNFEATTDNLVIPGGAADFDTQLFLFTDFGQGLLANDECFFGCPNNHSHLLPNATDGTGQNIPNPGLYFVVITPFDSDPLGFNGVNDLPIFNQFNNNEVSGPDGPGGFDPLSAWTGNLQTPLNTGSYAIALNGAEFIPVGFDCPGGECIPVPFGPHATQGDCEIACGICSPFTCDDGNLCTDDVCDAKKGCVHIDISCDDGDSCTNDFCNPGTGTCFFEPLLPQPFEPGTKHEPPSVPSANCEVCPDDDDEMSVLDPVYLFSGEYYETNIDMTIPGRGLDFVWSRKYRSKLGTTTTMGNNWDSAYNSTVATCGPNMIVSDGNSRQDHYLPQPDGTWVAPELFRVLEQNPDTSLTLTFPDLTTLDYFPIDGSIQSGLLAMISDRSGNTMEFIYDVTGLLTTVRDTLHTPLNPREINVTYNPDGFVESVTDFTGRSVTYDYYQDGDAGGSAGDLKSVTTPIITGTPNGNDFPTGKTTTYTYSTGFADERLNHNLLTVTDPKGQVYLTNVYATTLDDLDINFDRVFRQYWGDQNATTGDILDAVYIPVVPGPSNNGAVIKVIVNDRVGDVKEFYYDDRNNGVMEQIYTGRANPDQPTTETVNRPTGQVRVSDPVFFETRYTFNLDALVTSILFPNGNSEVFVYDQINLSRRSQGNALEHQRIAGPLGGDQAVITEFFEYDQDFGACCGTNFVTRHVDGRGNETLHAYDSAGNRTQTTHRIPSILEEFEYNAFGQLTAHVHPDNGSGVFRRDEYDYYSGGPQQGYRSEQVIDTTGVPLTTTYEYDNVGNVTRTVDPRGNDEFRVYNALDQVVRHISRETTTGSGVRYESDTYYDANDNIVRIDTPNVDDAGIVQPNSHFTTIFEYELLDNVTRSCTERSDAILVVTDVTCDDVVFDDFLFTDFEYDANRNRTVIRYGEAVNGNDPGNTVGTEYDERDLQFRVTRNPGGTAQSTTQYDYDGNENIVQIPEGIEDTAHTHEAEYDGFDRITTETDAMGNGITRHYDANSNVVSEQTDGETTDVVSGIGNVRLSESAFVYDALDRQTQSSVQFFDTATQNPLTDGLVVTVTDWSDFSRTLSVTDDNANVTIHTYDSANRRATTTDPKGNTTTYGYDANDNVVTVTETDKSDLGGPDEVFVRTNVYDALDRMLSETDNVGNVQTHGYDSRDNRVLDTDANGEDTRYGYDAANRIIQTTRDLDGDGADGDGTDVVTIQVWDDSNRMIAEGDDNGNVTRHAYDSLGRIIATRMGDGSIYQTGTGLTSGDWLPGATAPDLSGFVTGYDAHDNAVTRTDANGSVFVSTFDLVNRVINVLITPAAGVSTDTTFENFEYDGLSRMTRAEDDDTILLRAYDSLGRVTSETLNSRTTTSTYDGVGNHLTCVYPGGRTITTTYDDLDRASTIADGGGLVATYDYIGRRRVERREYGNGTRTDYTYDGILPNPAGDFGERQIIGTTHTRIVDSLILDARIYSWDPNQNKARRDDIRPGGPGFEHTYSYDAINRLTRSTAGAGGPLVRDTNYDLDGVGNRSAVSGGPSPGAYGLDLSDSPVNQYSQTPFDSRTYDANGNLIAIEQVTQIYGDVNNNGVVALDDILCVVDAFLGNGGCTVSEGDIAPCGGGDNLVTVDDILSVLDAFRGQGLCPDIAEPVVEITYDAYNRMTEYDDVAAAERHTYEYDGMNRIAGTRRNADGLGDSTNFYYDGIRIIEERNAVDVVEATYVYGIYVDEVLNMQRGGLDYYYHGDDICNVMALSDSSGTVVERYEYDDYGRVVDSNSLNGLSGPLSALGNPYGFTGRRYDDKSGLYYYRARYLDPESGRFTTRDPLGIWADGHNTGNGYTYAGNNPWTMVDPTGQISWAWAKCMGMCLLGIDDFTVRTLMAVGFKKVIENIVKKRYGEAKRGLIRAGILLGQRLGKERAAKILMRINGKLIPGAGWAMLAYDLCSCTWKCWGK